MILKIRHIIIIILFFQFGAINAQLSEIQFENITAADGLVDDDQTFDIYQDSKGFVWFGAIEGLSRYDGYSFKNFGPNPLDSTSLSDGWIYSIYEDYNGQLWFGTQYGLNLFDPATESFKNYLHERDDSTSISNAAIYDIIQGDESGLWIATGNGLDLFNYQTESFTHYKHQPDDSSSISSNDVRELYIDSHEILWIGTGNRISGPMKMVGGIDRYLPETNSFKRYQNYSDNKCGIQGTMVVEINEDHHNQLYVGTGNSILYLYDRDQDCFQILSDKQNDLPYAPFGEGFASLQPGVNNFLQDMNGEYWVTTFSGGINRFDLEKGFMNYYPSNEQSELSLKSKNVTAFYEDKQGLLWLSVYKNGIYKITPSQKRFHSFSKNKELKELISDVDVREIYEDSFGSIWIGTSEDVIRYDPSSGEINKYSDLLDFEFKHITDFYEDSSGQLWIGGALMELTKLHIRTDRFNVYVPDLKDAKSINSSGIMDILNDKENNSLWFGTLNNGVERLDLNTKLFKSYQHDPRDNRSLSNNKVWITLKDKNHDLWIGTSSGLNLFSPETNDFSRFFPGIEIHTLIEDSQNNLWLGTIGHGLILFNRYTKDYKIFTEKDGLASDFIFSMVEDNEGFIWLSTTVGLSKLDTRTMNFISYSKQDGVLNQFTKWSDGVLKTRNGDLLFGGNRGITAFSPSQFTINKFIPYVSITGLSIFDKPYLHRGGLDSLIILDYDQNNITFDYVALHFKNPARNKYMVKLEPYEKDWSKATNEHKTRYTNLAPGDYTFRVKASNSDGIWNEEGESLSIIITPPWWATWWAYSFYFLMLFGFLFSVRKFELNRQRKNAAIKESKLRAEAAELQAQAAEAQAKVIQAENDRKTKELEEARQLQLSMLPKELPQLPNLDIAVYMKTATEVGGDYYDFSIKNDGSLNVCLGDATGHGMKAGTLVSMIKSLFTANSIDKPINEFFASSNEALKNSKLDKMMMAFAMMNIKDRKLEISNAGIPPIYLYRSLENRIEEVKLNGLPLGAMRGTKYEVYTSELEEGDALLMLSDGLPELQNEKEKQYGYDRVIKSFKDYATNSANEIINHLKDERSKWVNDKDPDDDVTFVVIKVK